MAGIGWTSNYFLFFSRYETSSGFLASFPRSGKEFYYTLLSHFQFSLILTYLDIFKPRMSLWKIKDEILVWNVNHWYLQWLVWWYIFETCQQSSFYELNPLLWIDWVNGNIQFKNTFMTDLIPHRIIKIEITSFYLFNRFLFMFLCFTLLWKWSESNQGSKEQDTQAPDIHFFSISIWTINEFRCSCQSQ